MLDKVLLGLTCIAATIVGLAMLPYCLVRVWVDRIPFKRKARGLDFDCMDWKP